jgi:hypothetical protein
MKRVTRSQEESVWRFPILQADSLEDIDFVDPFQTWNVGTSSPNAAEITG